MRCFEGEVEKEVMRIDLFVEFVQGVLRLTGTVLGKGHCREE